MPSPGDTLVFAIAAAVIVLLNRKAMLTRNRAMTEILTPSEEGGPGDACITASRSFADPVHDASTMVHGGAR